MARCRLCLGYVKSSDLWGKCTSSAELEIHSNDRVLCIG
jgi:hypothetical protein